ncbi:predicted protein [Naegleria gruberi]|uniref:Predicted protein n=1 Tax=Naegleria gruberi TaxID=5762 RepID=D2VS05_NAEGR|nr:uncharacterized protein NAEGRDRAFT_71768 [Naegleria gruberi]EFC40263.1 predicted protein [Naegleria gruberi]|eukprot:XP_002673007.1 predicted protein [Naegleria gruberi strain NEG-M]
MNRNTNNNNDNNNNNINESGNTSNNQTNRNENVEGNTSKAITAVHKSMIGCVASGIVFDFVDRAIGNIYSESGMYEITLLMRCICVFVADRFVFHIVMEILDRIEEQQWTFSNEISNIEGASCAGMSAIAYNLATELGIYICKEHIGTDNDWFIGLFCIPFIAVATGIGLIIGVLEGKLWQILDSAMYSKVRNIMTSKRHNITN